MLQLLQLAQDYSSYDNSFVDGGFSTSGSILLMVIIAVAGYIVQARLQSVFHKYSQVAFPGNLTGAEVAEKMLREFGLPVLPHVRRTNKVDDMTFAQEPLVISSPKSAAGVDYRRVVAALM